MLTAMEKQTLIRNLIKYEDNIPHMYLDTAGLVTVGIGNLLRTVQDAQKLPFLTVDNKKATPEQITEDFETIKKQPKGHYAKNYKRFTKLYLKHSDILAAVNHHIDLFYRELTINYPAFRSFPSEVKLALFDMGFNLGANGLKVKFPKMNKAISKKDWVTDAKESHRKPPVAEARNNYVKQLFEKAAKSAMKPGMGMNKGVAAHGWRRA